MNPTQGLVAVVQQDRERSTACFRYCCQPTTLVDRVASAMRLAPASC